MTTITGTRRSSIVPPASGTERKCADAWDHNWECAKRLCTACEQLSPSGEYAGLHCGYEICKTGRTRIKTAVPTTVVVESAAKHHRLQQLFRRTAAVALLG